MAFTPDDLASLLQLPSTSEDSPLRTLNPGKRYSVMLQLFDELDARSLTDLQIFVAEFNSKHLPPFVQQCMVTFVSTDDHPLNWQNKINLLSTLSTKHLSSAGRFVRENAGIARELYVLLADALGYLMETDAFTNFGLYEIYACSLITLFSALGMNLFTHVSDLIHLPVLRDSNGKDVDAVLRLLRIQPPVAHNQIHLESLSILDNMIHGRLNVAGIRRATKVTKGAFVWERCEIEAATDEHSRDCSRLSTGEEMQACGRCRAVRYCSREHQRLDWKRHKRICFEPNW